MTMAGQNTIITVNAPKLLYHRYILEANMYNHHFTGSKMYGFSVTTKKQTLFLLKTIIYNVNPAHDKIFEIWRCIYLYRPFFFVTDIYIGNK